MAEPSPGLYQHFKGTTYKVLGIGIHSETEEPLVIYINPEKPKVYWLRPPAMFVGQVDRDDYSGPRFKKLYCERCQIAEPVWGARCRLCFLSPIFVAVAWRLAAIIFALLLLALAVLVIK